MTSGCMPSHATLAAAAGLSVDGRYAWERKPDNSAVILQQTPSPVAAYPLSEALRSWAVGEGPRGARKPAPNTVAEASAACRRFIELFGDMPIREIHKAYGRQYRDAVAKVPKGLPADMRRLPLPILLTRDIAAYEPRAATTINKSLILLGAVLARAEQDGHFDGVDWRNPFDVAFEVDAADEDYYEGCSQEQLLLRRRQGVLHDRFGFISSWSQR